jgi:hypothetical protein
VARTDWWVEKWAGFLKKCDKYAGILKRFLFVGF